MNSQLVFRLANHEDLGYVRESFEAAGESLMEDLPQLDTGVGICAGTMVAMPVRCDVPLFASRAIVELQIEELPEDRVGLEAAVKSVLPEAAPVEDGGELVIYSDGGAEVTLRGHGWPVPAAARLGRRRAARADQRSGDPGPRGRAKRTILQPLVSASPRRLLAELALHTDVPREPPCNARLVSSSDTAREVSLDGTVRAPRSRARSGRSRVAAAGGALRVALGFR